MIKFLQEHYELLIMSCMVLMLSLIIFYEYHIKKFKKNIIELQNQVQSQAKIAVAKSKAVTRGKISEEFLPLFPDFPYNMSDAKFSGSPIDYVVFNGMSNLRDDGEGEIEIIFADVKTNSASKTKIQRAIKEAIRNGRFRWEDWIITEDKQLKIK